MASNRSPIIPTGLKIAHTAYVAVLMPIYWHNYGPANFLWFSDIALFMITVAMWRESRLLASIVAISALAVETAWNLDFFVHLMTGHELLGAAEYMFRSEIPLWLRSLSLFHIWLPPLSLWLVWRIGYDRRALIAQTLLAWFVLPITYLF